MEVKLYLDRFGGGAAIKEFFLSLFKTMLAAGISYIVIKLGNVHVSTPEAVSLVALIRAGLTGTAKQLTTTKEDAIG